MAKDEDYSQTTEQKWTRAILIALNILAGIFTFINIRVLYSGFHSRGFLKNSTSDINNTDNIGRKKMILFYYVINFIPFLVCCVAHYGAQYPHQAIWIFPSLGVILAINYIWFVQMMYIACGGKENVKKHLLTEPDHCGMPIFERCCKKCCCMKSNAWDGLNIRIFFCYLVFVKPIFAYYISYEVQTNGESYQKSTAGNVLRIFLILCTFAPLQGIKSFGVTLKNLSRIDRTTAKVNLIRVLVPLTQLQQSVIDILVSADVITDVDNVDAQYLGARLLGLLLSLEMLCIIMVSHFVYRAEDLLHWNTRQQLQWRLDSISTFDEDFQKTSDNPSDDNYKSLDNNNTNNNTSKSQSNYDTYQSGLHGTQIDDNNNNINGDPPSSLSKIAALKNRKQSTDTKSKD